MDAREEFAKSWYERLENRLFSSFGELAKDNPNAADLIKREFDPLIALILKGNLTLPDGRRITVVKDDAELPECNLAWDDERRAYCNAQQDMLRAGFVQEVK
ncbi:MAG: hypothetical protein PHU23_06035 [Dehalococcoidales bacterium]|nr:hypothetical protein [Dehalococcoidales bacterium]